MGKGKLSHLDKGVLYVPVNGSESVQDIYEKYKDTDKTIVIFRSGKTDMKHILKELLKTRLNA